MKNTTFRKKALLSSVAMLLVALVALGSATFAWFSSNKVVTADGMKVQAAASKGLVINKDNQAEQGWDNEVTFTQPDAENKARTEVVLSPVSVGYDANNKKLATTAYYADKVDRVGGGVWETGNTDIGEFKLTSIPAAATTGEGFAENGYFAVYEVAVKSTGDTINNVVGKIKYTAGNPDAANYIRIAVLDGSMNVLKIFGDESSPTAITNNSPITATPQTGLEGIPTTQTTFTTISALKDAQEFTVVVWFEGQDQNCIDDNQRAVGSVDLEFSY